MMGMENRKPLDFWESGMTNTRHEMCIRDRCRYLDEVTGGRGVIFATGTPISNSMTEMYTLMRYLQRCV